MVFFKLGKIDKSGAAGDKSGAPTPGAPGASLPSAETGVKATDGERKHEKKSKKNKGEDHAQSGGGSNDNTSHGPAPAAASSGAAGPSVNDFISKTKSQQRQGLKPSGPELIAYARYLGIDPVADHDLLWIAVEALEAPLPSEWTEHFDSSDRVFYYNATSRVSSWTHPLEHIYRDTYKTIIHFRNSNLSAQERGEQLHKLQLECQQMEHDVHHEINLWTEHTDEQGHRFYFNREERVSTWTDPRPAKCHVLYLKMKMLRVLQQNGGGGLGDKALSGFAPLAPSDRTEGGAQKRPKVGAAVGGSDGNSLDPPGGLWSQGDGSAGAGAADKDPLNLNGDPGSDDDHGKKKKKKKRKDGLEAGLAPPPRNDQLGGGMGHSQSAPSVGGGKGVAPPPTELGMGGSMGGGNVLGQPSGPSNFGFGNLLDQPEGLSSVGRVKVKAGIRLKPIDAAMPGQTASSSGLHEGSNTAGMHGSVSVPVLQPLKELHADRP